MSDDELFDYYLYVVTLPEPVEETDPFAEERSSTPCVEILLFFLLPLLFAVLSLFA